ncbi:hypothetical protein [Methanocella sp. MCL-LM]|uniref:hypothetical protein n=1 Tax=Methanocella sp. MCL-LM TaxID=3412035 RepID=UPI003C74861A
MVKFKPLDMKGTPIDDQFMSWNEMIQEPYDKETADAYTKTRVILMNGIENNSVISSHAMARLIRDDEVKKQMAIIRRADSQHQETINWLNPANASVLETTVSYEQVAVDLTSNLAKNEPDPYFKQVLDFALLEDFDHLYRYSNMMTLLEGKDPTMITQNKTEIKPGRPTVVEHRHPVDEMRKHFDKDTASLKSKMNQATIVSAEQQTMLFYRSHGYMYGDDLARKLYAEIAEIEEQHVSQYELVGDPDVTFLEKLTLLQLNEAYNYYSCAQTETDSRIKKIWERFCADEITHFNMCAQLLEKVEGRDVMDVLKQDSIDSLIVFEPNKDYVNNILETQVNLQPYNMEFMDANKLPGGWLSYAYRDKVNAGGVPSEDVIARAQSTLAAPGGATTGQ